MTVKMQRGNTTANVHPAEVENYAKGGWEVLEAKAAKKEEKPEVEAVSDEPIYDVYKVTDGKKARRVSRANLTKAEAEIWMKGRDDEYTLVISD